MPNRIAHICAVFIFMIAAVSVLDGAAYAGPGHDHDHGGGHAAANQTRGPTNPRLTLTSKTYELVGILVDHKLTLYLDHRADTAPVTGAKIKLTIDGSTRTAAPQPDGTYLFDAPALSEHKKFEVVAEISGAEANDLLVGTLDATEVINQHGGEDPFGHDHALHHQEGSDHSTALTPHAHSNHAFNVQTVVGFGVGILVGLLSAVLLRARNAKPVALIVGAIALLVSSAGAKAGPGHEHQHTHGVNALHGSSQDVPGRTADGKIFIPKPTQRLLEIRTQVLKPATTKRSERLIGRVIADPNRNGLVQSTIRGRIKPAARGLPVIGQTVTAGDTLALVEPAFAPIDASDVRQTAGDLEQRIAVLKARLARRSQLVRKNVASEASLQDIEIELKGLQARRRQLDESHQKPEVLVAPVTGVVANVRVVSGQVIESSDTLFHIIDPNSLWVEALAFDASLSIAKDAKAYTEDGSSLSLSFIGRSRTLQQQATVLHYEINAPTASLNIGAPLNVVVETGQPVTGLIVPKDAIAEAPNGQTVAYIRDGPEWYRPVPVRTESLDGRQFLIVAGLKAGDQVITRGASLISQIR